MANTQQPPSPTYTLTKDVTGKPPPPRGPQTLTAVFYKKNEDGKDVKQEVKFKVPIPPNLKCKKCYGRGYIGLNIEAGEIFICTKCFPMLA